jgi:hypothetical protein
MFDLLSELYLSFRKQRKFWNKSKKLKRPKIRDKGNSSYDFLLCIDHEEILLYSFGKKIVSLL